MGVFERRGSLVDLPLHGQATVRPSSQSSYRAEIEAFERDRGEKMAWL
jgi:hypothetical protein